MLSYLKLGFVRMDKESKGTLSAYDFKNVMHSILKPHKDDTEMFEHITNFVKDSNNQD